MASSATLYGASWIDLARVPARRAPRQYALRSQSCTDGYVSAGVKPSGRRPKVDALGIVEPVAGPESDDIVAAVIRIDYEAERKIVPTIRMGDWN